MSRARRRTVKGLVILGSVLAFLSVFAIWTERQALNTDDWVSTSGRLIQNETIRTALGDYLVDQLYENVDVEAELKDILPGDTKDLAGPAAGGLRQVAGDGAEKVLETSTAQSLWEDANRSAHEQLRRRCWKTRAKRSRPRRQRQPQPRQPAHQPRRARSASARTWPKSCRPTRARSRSSTPTS